MSKSEKGLWDIAIDDSKRTEKAAKKLEESNPDYQTSDETTLFIMGSREGGKSTLVARLLDKEEKPTTTALEYTFGRKNKGGINLGKSVVHIWELGGGTSLSKLVEIPVHTDSIETLSVVLVLDLSKPHELWNTLETLMTALRSRVDQVTRELSSKDSGTLQRMQRRVWKRFGEAHGDKDLVDPLVVPLLIIGSKYDLFQQFELDKRKVMCKTLRAVAHYYGASLQFCTSKMESIMGKTRTLLNNLAFGPTSHSTKSASVDPGKPLAVAQGQDSFKEIGPPPIAEGDLGSRNYSGPLDQWKQAYTSVFPQESSSRALPPDPCKEKQYLEAAIDNMRAQKDEELERYRKISARKTKETRVM